MVGVAGPGRKNQHAAQTRSRLLAAAEAVFCRDGIAPATLEAIVAQAGLTRGALYWHFAGKSELLQVVLQRHRMPLERVAVAALRTDPAGVLAQAVAETVTEPASRRLCHLLVRNPEVPEVRQRLHQARLRLQRCILVALRGDATWQPGVWPRQSARAAGWVVRACVVGALGELVAHPLPPEQVLRALQPVLAQALRSGRAGEAR